MCALAYEPPSFQLWGDVIYGLPLGQIVVKSATIKLKMLGNISEIHRVRTKGAFNNHVDKNGKF